MDRKGNEQPSARRTGKARRFGWRLRGATAMLLLMGIVGLTNLVPQASVSTDAAISHKHYITQGPLLPPSEPAKPLGQAKNVPDRTKIARAFAPSSAVQTDAVTGPTIDMKVLVIAADGKEADLPAIQQALDYLGVPYTLYMATQTPGALTADKLTDPANPSHAFYQGVILTTGDLVYHDNATGTWPSALTTQEWTNLINFEATFGIRRVSWYTSWPSPDYGFQWGGTAATTSPLNMTFTSLGNTIFGMYVSTANPLPIQTQYAYTLLAKPFDATTQPVLTAPDGSLLAAIYTHKDATGYPLFDTLALTFDNSPYLTHSLVLSYGLVNWVTKGFFLGERHAILTAQPDDVFNDNDMWSASLACGTSVDNTGTTFRVSGSDLQSVVQWQQAKQSTRVTQNFQLELPFNGVGTTKDWLDSEGNPPGQFNPDTLTPAVKQLQGQFNWISHTWDHEDLDAMSYTNATSELTQNNQLANKLKLDNYTKTTLVTPNVSGLTNVNALQAMYDTGVRYIVTDTSKSGYNNPSPNAGIINPLQTGILMIPRHPTNLYFNVEKPQDWLAEDNCLYPPGAWGHVNSYQALLDRESNMLLTYLLKGDIDPLMFHQPNLGAYDGTHSLLGDLMDATFAKYSALVSVPILSPTEQELGQRMATRMAYNASGVNAKMVGTTQIVVTAQQAATIPITGLLTSCNKCTAEPYAGQNITWVKLNAGQSVTLTIQNPLPAPVARVSVTSVSPTSGPLAGGTTVKINGAGFTAGATVSFGTAAANVTSITSSTITVTSPASATAGTVPVTVATTDGQTMTLNNAFTYTTSGTANVGGAPIDTPTPGPAPAPRTAPGGSTTSSGGSPAATPAPAPTGR